MLCTSAICRADALGGAPIGTPKALAGRLGPPDQAAGGAHGKPQGQGVALGASESKTHYVRWAVAFERSKQAGHSVRSFSYWKLQLDRGQGARALGGAPRENPGTWCARWPAALLRPRHAACGGQCPLGAPNVLWAMFGASPFGAGGWTARGSPLGREPRPLGATKPHSARWPAPF